MGEGWDDVKDTLAGAKDTATDPANLADTISLGAAGIGTYGLFGAAAAGDMESRAAMYFTMVGGYTAAYAAAVGASHLRQQNTVDDAY